MKERIFPFIIALSALSVSASAAFYSVFGLSHLFAGASTQVIIMAGALEVAKLVVASLLYQYWDKINKLLRAYFIIATFILMVITSGGIYGYLSGAYQETSTQSEFLDRQVAIIDSKRTRFIEQRDDLKLTVKELTTALSNPTMIQYVDKESGQLVTTTSSRQRKSLESRLNASKIDLDMVTDSISALDIRVLDAQINNESARELGPLKYMSTLTGQPMATIVNWFMMLIIFVFDPLAIAMVVAANMAFEQLKIKTKENVYGETVPEEKIYEVLNMTQEEISKELDKNDKEGTGMKWHHGVLEKDAASPSLEEMIKRNEEVLDFNQEKKPPPPPPPKNPTWGTPGGAR